MGMSQKERDITYQSAVRFCEKNPAAVLELLDEDDIREQREQRRAAGRLAKISKVCSGNTTLAKRVLEFADSAGLGADAAVLDKFLTLLVEVTQAATSENSTCVGDSLLTGSDLEAEVDTNICCFATGKLYTEAMLGVGVARERRNLTTAAELLSKEAFDGGLRQSTNKSAFEFFLPVWINETHAAKCKAWQDSLRRSYMEVGKKVFEVTEEDDAILEVFPRLINQMIVEVMRPDAAKSAAIATFEAMCNFWRTFRWLVDTRPTLHKQIASVLSKFVSDESCRHKDVTPDLGVALVLFTVVHGQEGCPTRKDFIDAYADENALRCVMWWQRSGTRPEPMPVFEATRVSREICMFQMMVVDVVIADVDTTLKLVEGTNCKMTERLERLQVQWRNQKTSINTWAQYFKCIDASPPAFPSESAWIANCVDRAAAKGPKYGGGKGDAKGSNGKGAGKGGSKGGFKNGGKGWGR